MALFGTALPPDRTVAGASGRWILCILCVLSPPPVVGGSGCAAALCLDRADSVGKNKTKTRHTTAQCTVEFERTIRTRVNGTEPRTWQCCHLNTPFLLRTCNVTLNLSASLAQPTVFNYQSADTGILPRVACGLSATPYSEGGEPEPTKIKCQCAIWPPSSL